MALELKHYIELVDTWKGFAKKFFEGAKYEGIEKGANVTFEFRKEHEEQHWLVFTIKVNDIAIWASSRAISETEFNLDKVKIDMAQEAVFSLMALGSGHIWVNLAWPTNKPEEEK